MQNSILQYNLLDNTVDNFVLLNVTKQQMFSVPKEESQMFPSSTYNYTGVMPGGYNNDPVTQTENRDLRISNLTDENLNASFMPTDYIGLAMISIPSYINETFADFNVYNTLTSTVSPFYSSLGNLTNVSVGIQLIKVPANCFITTLTDPITIAANNGSALLKNFGKYYLTITPKYIQSNIVAITAREQFEFANLVDNQISIGGNIIPIYKRRTVYSCDKFDFAGATQWGFMNDPLQSGRLVGSRIEIWSSDGIILKQTKVINENAFNFSLSNTNMQFVMSPDNVGYDPSWQDAAVGDIIRVYPRETSFDQITVDISYTDNTKTVQAALDFMLNDAARDITTGMYEVYDSNGIMIDNTGAFNGKVVQQYQVSQYGNYEVRKKIN